MQPIEPTHGYSLPLPLGYSSSRLVIVHGSARWAFRGQFEDWALFLPTVGHWPRWKEERAEASRRVLTSGIPFHVAAFMASRIG